MVEGTPPRKHSIFTDMFGLSNLQHEVITSLHPVRASLKAPLKCSVQGITGREAPLSQAINADNQLSMGQGPSVIKSHHILSIEYPVKMARECKPKGVDCASCLVQTNIWNAFILAVALFPLGRDLYLPVSTRSL